MATTRHVQYSPLPVDDDYDYNIVRKVRDSRFDYARGVFDRIPWKSIALAVFLLFFGSLMLLLSFFIFTAHMGGDKSQAYGLLALGILTFMPGFYETRVAYYSWRGAKVMQAQSQPMMSQERAGEFERHRQSMMITVSRKKEDRSAKLL